MYTEHRRIHKLYLCIYIYIYIYIHISLSIYIYTYITLLRIRWSLGVLTWIAPNQELESSFCRWTAGQQLARKGNSVFFTDTDISVALRWPLFFFFFFLSFLSLSFVFIFFFFLLLLSHLTLFGRSLVHRRRHILAGGQLGHTSLWGAPRPRLLDLRLQVLGGAAPNLLTKIIPAKIRWLKTSGKFPMDMRTSPLQIKILFESNPLKSRILVRRLAV